MEKIDKALELDGSKIKMSKCIHLKDTPSDELDRHRLTLARYQNDKEVFGAFFYCDREECKEGLHHILTRFILATGAKVETRHFEKGEYLVVENHGKPVIEP